MHSYTLFGLCAAPLVAAKYPVFQNRQINVTAAAATVPSTVEEGIQTECKTCPYSLCTNVAAYEYGHDMSLSCWTRGDTIVETKCVLNTFPPD